MKPITIILALFILCCTFSFTTKDLKPFSFLKAEKELVFRNDRALHPSYDTLDVHRIQELSSLQFEKKGFSMESYGNTSDYSINVYRNEERICLIAVWNIENDKLAININHLEKEKFYYGYVIEKHKFESLYFFKDNS